MSYLITTSYQVRCDDPDCDNTSPVAASASMADETAVAYAWHLGTQPGEPDYCPEHKP